MKEQIVRREKEVGAVIRRARKRANLTQKQLGERAQLRQATISQLETGGPGVQINTMMRCLSALSLELVVRERTQGSMSDIEELF